MESKYRKPKAEVTGKITASNVVYPEAPVEQQEYMEYEKKPQVAGAKEEMIQNYRDALQAQVEAKRAADAHEKELRRGAVGFQTESMYKEAEKEQEMPTKTKERMTAKEIQYFNQQLAQQKASEKSVKKHYEAYEPAPEPPRESEMLARAMPQGELENDVKAQKKEMAMKLREALELQMAEDRARKQQEREDRIGYKKQ